MREEKQSQLFTSKMLYASLETHVDAAIVLDSQLTVTSLSLAFLKNSAIA